MNRTMHHICWAMLFALIYQTSSSPAQGSVNRLDQAWDSLEKLGKGGLSAGQSMVGYVPESYYYNYRVWNDSPAQVLIGVQGMINVQTAKAPGDFHTLSGILYPQDFHDYILCTPARNTGSLGYKTRLVMQIYMAVFEDSKTKNYFASFDQFDAYNKKQIAQNAQFKVAADSLISKKNIELPLEESVTKAEEIGQKITGVTYFRRKLRPEIENNAFAKKLFAVTDESGFKKNSIVADTTYEHSDAEVEEDQNIYFYHIYRDTQAVKSEYLEWGGTVKVPGQTTAFAGTFYVSSKQKELVLSFYKDGVQYSVALEPGSFNLLQSTDGVTESIRPLQKNEFTEKFGFQMYQGDPKKQGRKLAYIPISAYGPAYVYDERTTEEVSALKPIKPVLGTPRQYTYELYDYQGTVLVACHSMRPGEYPMPSSPNKDDVRDINPITCHIWLQSAQEVVKQIEETSEGKVNYSTIPFDTGQQVWVAYQTGDSSILQKLDKSVTNFKLVRPRLSEKQARLYICSVATTDQKKAQECMRRLASGLIALPASHQEISDLANVAIEQTIAQMQPNTYGVVVDNKGSGATGVSMHILATDIFTPNGLGSGDRYYYVYPPMLQVDMFAGMLPLAKPLSAQDLAPFAQQLTSWISLYARQGKEAALQPLNDYLKKFGDKELFSQASPSAQPVLTKQAEKIIESLLTGKISIAHPPLVWNAGVSYPISSPEAPQGWPKESTEASAK